jgi:multidrug efflux pump subunit AcrA (membrane-fusion protein)
VWQKRRRPSVRRWLRPALWLCLLAAVAALLAVVRVPLRVVANCEVVAKNPRLVSAPLDGVIDEVVAKPGQIVAEGDAIAVYDSRLMEEELKISRRQVEVVRAELASARARGFAESRYRGDTALLEARLEQELARLEALEVRFARRRITAPVAGTVQLDDARAWRGRPVATGQAILWLVNPADSRVKVMLPQDDRIDFDGTRPISVHLHALGGEGRAARLTYVSSFAQTGQDGIAYFPAEAEWEDGGSPPPLGLRGTASIYGQETSLGYWLFRRPLSWARRWLGV